jgi:hypothetical protein
VNSKNKEQKSWTQRFSFLRGFILGLSVTSVIALAATISKPYTFTDGSVISSSEVNDNFDTLYNKVNDSSLGFIARLSTNYTITCSTSGVTFAIPSFDVVDDNDGNYNNSTFEYTVPADGYYWVFVDASVVSNTLFATEVTVNGTGQNIGTDGSPKLRKFLLNDVIKFHASCDDGMYANVTIDSTKAYFGIKKL